jgi:hypothetical protein
MTKSCSRNLGVRTIGAIDILYRDLGGIGNGALRFWLDTRQVNYARSDITGDPHIYVNTPSVRKYKMF